MLFFVKSTEKVIEPHFFISAIGLRVLESNFFHLKTNLILSFLKPNFALIAIEN